ncbi:MAG: BatD family protein [Bacteroidota bacterium]
MVNELKLMFRYKIITVILFILSLWGHSVSAQEVEFSGSAKPVVTVGETFTLVYAVNAQALNFKGPNVPGFTVLSGPLTSTSSSIRSVNGRTTMTMSYTFTYFLQATKEGSFDIQPAFVTVDRKNYQSNTLTIKVVKPAGGQQQLQGRGNQQQGAPESSSNDVLVKAYVSNANPLQGEEVVVTYKLCFKVNIGNANITKVSSFPGFWSQNLMNEKEKQQPYKQVIDGEQYTVVDIRKNALFALKSGKLVIDPLELSCVAEVRRQTRTRTGDPFFDDFFNDSFFNNAATVEKNVKSSPLVINVRPLPTEGKPSDFNGAVGNFSFQTQLDKNHVKANEPINLKCVVAGQGNIQLIDKMNIIFPPDFETYDPKITSDVKTSASGISGSQSFEYLIIPRKPGRFTIKPITFTYYDLVKHKYISITSPLYTIDIDKGTGESATLTYSGASKEEIKYIGSDIRHIKGQNLVLYPVGSFFFLSTWFYLLLILPLILFIAMVLLMRKYREQQSDTIRVKNRKATKVAIKRLKKAHDYLKAGQQDAFYVEVSQTLWGYLSDKFGIPMAELSMDSMNEALINKNVREELVTQFSETLQETEFARFAPGDKALVMEKTYERALESISKIERELR